MTAVEVPEGFTARDMDLLGVCVHEAGHAVWAVLSGGRVFSAAVVNSRTIGLRGTTFCADLSRAFDASTALAGPFAEARWRAGRTPTAAQVDAALRRSGGHSAVRSDRDVLTASGGMDAVPSSFYWLMERCWPAVVAVAKTLVRGGEVVHDDVCAALGLSADEARHPYELAVLKSGEPLRVREPARR